MKITPNEQCHNCMQNMEDRFDDKIKNVYLSIESKVSWKHFTWIISTIIALYVVISAAIWMDLRDVQNKVDVTQTDVTEISTILKQSGIAK